MPLNFLKIWTSHRMLHNVNIQMHSRTLANVQIMTVIEGTDESVFKKSILNINIVKS